MLTFSLSSKSKLCIFLNLHSDSKLRILGYTCLMTFVGFSFAITISNWLVSLHTLKLLGDYDQVNISKRRKLTLTVVLHTLFINLASFCSCVTVATLGCIMLRDRHENLEFWVWFLVFIIPLTPILNPLLHMLSMKTFRQHLCDSLHKKWCYTNR